MKLLFLALSQRGYGETVIGMSLARQLLPLGVRSHFVVEASAEHLLHHSGFAYSVISAEMGPLAGLVIDDIVSTVEPDAFVLSDYVIYTRTMRSAFGLDPSHAGAGRPTRSASPPWTGRSRDGRGSTCSPPSASPAVTAWPWSPSPPGRSRLMRGTTSASTG
jgi:hypothetical protein